MDALSKRLTVDWCHVPFSAVRKPISFSLAAMVAIDISGVRILLMIGSILAVKSAALEALRACPLAWASLRLVRLPNSAPWALRVARAALVLMAQTVQGRISGSGKRWDLAKENSLYRLVYLFQAAAIKYLFVYLFAIN